MRGFLKFLLAIGLMILGILLIVSSCASGVQTGMADTLFGGHTNSAIFWVIGINGFVVFLGGMYMLRRR